MGITMEEISESIRDTVKEQFDESIKPLQEKITQFEEKLSEPAEENKAKAAIAGEPDIKFHEPDFKYKMFGDQLLDVFKANTIHDPVAWQNLDNANLTPNKAKTITGMSETIPADGGFLVQSDFVETLVELTHETGIIYPMCRKIKVSKNGLIMNAIDERSRATGSRFGGIRGYWLDEGGTKTASKPKLRQIELKLRKLIGLCYATDELLEDATALGNVITQGFAEEFGFLIDDAIIQGDGATKPLGILNAPVLVSVGKETGQSADTVVMENVQKIWNRVPLKNRMKGIWIINQDVEMELMNMALDVGSGGVPVYLPPGGLSAEPYSKLFGKNVFPIEQASALGDKGDIMFVDFNDYLIIEKDGMQTATSIHVAFTTDEQAFRFVYRIDGQPLAGAPVAAYKTGTKRSAFATVDARA